MGKVMNSKNTGYYMKVECAINGPVAIPVIEKIPLWFKGTVPNVIISFLSRKLIWGVACVLSKTWLLGTEKLLF